MLHLDCEGLCSKLKLAVGLHASTQYDGQAHLLWLARQGTNEVTRFVIRHISSIIDLASANQFRIAEGTSQFS